MSGSGGIQPGFGILFSIAEESGSVNPAKAGEPKERDP